MNKVILHLGLLVLLPVSSALAAGGWTSGGGELLKDARNPWFLRNVTEVFYCVQMDEANFGTTPKIASSMISKAFAFWKSEFKHEMLSEIPDQSTVHFPKIVNLKIATQKFTEVTCDKPVDIRFQFGVLDEQQIAYLKTPSEYAAVSVRTAYDPVNLKGQGFIYVAPAHGPLAYDPVGVRPDAWAAKDGNILYLALVHELGHVFGLNHSGPENSLMAERFVETIMSPVDSYFERAYAGHNFFSFPPNRSVMCYDSPIAYGFRLALALPDNELCLQYFFDHDPQQMIFGKTVLRVMASATEGGPQQEVLKADLASTGFFTMISNSTISLPPSQVVFTPSEYVTPGVPVLISHNLLGVSKMGTFIGADGKQYLLRFEFRQGNVSVEFGEMITPDGRRMIL